MGKRARVALAVLAVPLLSGDTCWQVVIDLRSCAQIVLQLDLDVGEALIPNCNGADSLQTIPGSETFAIFPTVSTLTVDEVPRNRLTNHIRLSATAAAVENTTETFDLVFTANPGAPSEFDQTINIVVNFGRGACLASSIPRPDACSELRAAAAAFFERCHPLGSGTGLTPAAADRLAETVCETADRFSDANTFYDGVLARECACDIQNMACTANDPFRYLMSCRNAFVGKLPPGAACDEQAPWQCGSGHCIAPDLTCGGTCEEEVPADGVTPCSDGINPELPCEPGALCNGAHVCERLPELGEPCGPFNLCVGDIDRFVFAGAVCNLDTGLCDAPVAAGGLCASGSGVLACDAISECDGATCQARPDTGEACALQNAGVDWLGLLVAGASGCRIDASNNANGDFCMPTDLATLTGVCARRAAGGAACGLGEGLMPLCEPGYYCAGLDPFSPVPQSGVCTPVSSPGEACDTGWVSAALGPQCTPGYFCRGDILDPNGTCECSP
jgi:hypothetical protein